MTYSDFAGAAQLEVIQSLRLMSSVRYNSSDPSHVAQLMDLWAAAHESSGKEVSPKSERWKELGFQGSDPATDFRAAGLFGLQSLVYFARHRHNILAEHLMTQKEQPGLAFPWAATALNVHFLLVGRLLLYDPKRDVQMVLPGGDSESGDDCGESDLAREDLRTMCWLVCDAETQAKGGGCDAFHELFSCAMQICELLWQQLLIRVDREKEKVLAEGGADAALQVLPAILRFNQECLGPLWSRVRALLEQAPTDLNELRQLCEVEIGRPC